VNRSIPHISLHHVTRFEPITAAHFDQRYNNIQIVTGIDVNSESYFPKLREYCPSAEGTWAIFPQL